MVAKRKIKVGRKKEEQGQKSKHAPNWFLSIFKMIGIGLWFVLKGIWWVFKQTGRVLWLISEKIVSFASKESSSSSKSKTSKTLNKEEPEGIKLVETVDGEFKEFWKRLKNSDSLIGIVVGARGSGKSAISLKLLEELKDAKENNYAMGFKSKDLPKWIKVVDDVSDIKNNSFVVIDEGGILFSSRDSMSNTNKFLSELLLISRHKDLTILFISQNSSNIEVNTLRQADFLILKKSSLLQKDFERKKISGIYTKYSEDFNKYKNMKGVALIYSDEFVGFVHSDLPSFWNAKVSKGFR
ncbi:MAG: zonular occludens toxin domain-containing protein [Candidatus Woesearchaeota archaeon]|jgi:hypothetical protein